MSSYLSPQSLPSSPQVANSNQAKQVDLRSLCEQQRRDQARQVAPSDQAGKPSCQTCACTVCTTPRDILVPTHAVKVEQKRIDDAIQSFKTISGGKLVTLFNVLSFCLKLMKVVELQPDLTGEQKKEVVLQAITKVLQEQGGDMNILSMIPDYIDQTISIDKGEITIASPAEAAVACCSVLGTWLAANEKTKSRAKRGKPKTVK